MKVLFLDIDGVLNWKGTSDKIDGFVGLCPERIQRLNRITDAVPGVKIVISSTWRYAYGEGRLDYSRRFPELKRLLKKRGMTGQVIDKTEKKFSYVPRGGEIRMWIEDYQRDQRRKRKKDPLEAVVILDDDRAGMEGYAYTPNKWDDPDDPDQYRGSIDLRRFHVLTDFNAAPDGTEGGLLDHHVELAIGVLNGREIPVKKNPSHPEPEWVTVKPEDLKD